MCTLCGCGGAAPTDDGGTTPPHRHGPADHHHHHHHHDHHGHDHDPGHPSPAPTRRLRLEQDLLAKNDRLAAVNRATLAGHGAFAVNLMSSPGAGKTTLLVRTLTELAERPDRRPAVVIEGDQQTSVDADRIRATGTHAVQVNTGKGCHLDAAMIGHALRHFSAAELAGLVLIENVGNLVCPAGFDLGEAARVVLVSVTEGEDKPIKYPDMFATADLMVVTKVDLLPHLQFDIDRLGAYARRIKPSLPILAVSATTGAGLSAWYDWLDSGAAATARTAAEVAPAAD